jgi:hypothetical protein
LIVNRGLGDLGIFSDHVTRLYEAGLICIPVGDRKAPLQREWQLYCDNKPSQADVEKWETQYNHCDRIGLCMGQASGIVAFDFDYEFDERRAKIDKVRFAKDIKLVESHILRVLPQTPAIKVGKKGWTRFYKWTPQLGAGSNVSADRNGVRLFDFLSWHKQTIIPPSIHSIQDGKPLHYRWIGAPLWECTDDLPEIDLDPVLEIARLFGDAKAMDVNSRHGRLFSWLMRMTAVEKDPEVLTKLLLAKDLEVNASDAKGPYLRDKHHFRSGTPEANARRWVDRVLGWKSAKADVAGRGPGRPAEQTDGEVWNYFFEKSFPILRKDVLSEKVMVKRDPASAWVDIMALEGVLKSYASFSGLARTQVKEQLERFAFERKKLEFLCDIPAWDGVDRVKTFGDCVQSKEFTAEEMGLIFKHWGSGIFRRINSADEQNRCIIMKGAQGMGKDSLVKSMLGEFKPYFDTTNLSGTPKDVYEVISRIFVLHIEEFEQTAKLDVAFIKSIITQSSAFFRESFGREPSSKKVRLTMISTTNRDDVLRDPTGNRRFIVIPVEKILWKYPRNESIQVVAQFKAMFDRGQGATLPDSLEVKIKAILERFTPPDTSETILEMYRMTFDELTMKQHSPYPARHFLRGGEIQLALRELARANDVGPNRVKALLKANGFSRREDVGTVYYRNAYGWNV